MSCSRLGVSRCGSCSESWICRTDNGLPETSIRCVLIEERTSRRRNEIKQGYKTQRSFHRHRRVILRSNMGMTSILKSNRTDLEGQEFPSKMKLSATQIKRGYIVAGLLL